MRIYDADADREVGGRESRVQMAKAPPGGEGGKDEGGWDEGGSVIKEDPHCRSQRS